MTRRRKVSIKYESLDVLLARGRPENPKLHNIEGIDASVERFGYVTPVLVNEADDLVLEGHGRIDVLAALRAAGADPPPGIDVMQDGTWLVPVIHGVSLSAEDALAYTVTANRLVELGGWDDKKLVDLLSALAEGQGLAGVGYSERDLEELAASLDSSWSAPDPDLPVDDPGKVYVRPGQTWALGLHRIRCGDATQPQVISELLMGRQADALLTDPPYNVDYGRHSGASGATARQIANDALAPKEWEVFTCAWVESVVKQVRGAMYIFMSSKEWPVVARILSQAGAHWSDTLIWAKDQFVIGRSDYQRQYEPIWYGWPKGVKRFWSGARNEGDVWFFPRPRVSDLHPTMKPVALLERAIQNSTKQGARILDPFAGSGSTIIACERLGRRALALEIEPRWVQATIMRWENYTGQRAELIKEDDNETA